MSTCVSAEIDTFPAKLLERIGRERGGDDAVRAFTLR